MKKFQYKVLNHLGIHARPSALIAQTASQFKSVITIYCYQGKADAKNVLDILALQIKQNDILEVEIEGEDEEDAYLALEKTLQQHLVSKNQNKIFKIAFFGAKDYDKTFFSELVKDKGEGAYNCDITFIKHRLDYETADLAHYHDAICIFVNDNCSSEVVQKLYENNIRLILLRCAGFNNVDLKACQKYGITVLRVPAYSPYAVAEYAMAIVQEANRRLHKAYAKVKENNFALSGLLGLDLHHKVAGIIGTGKIGICMARICQGYGMTVLGWDAYPNLELERQGLLKYVSQDELFQKADLISLHAPLFKETKHIINEQTISLMKDQVMLVNTARGALIDNEALIKALKQGKFQAVALDVYEGEDENVYTNRSDEIITNDIAARLLMFPQVVLTSHQGFFTQEALQSIAVTTMENARNFNEGNDFKDSIVKE